MSEGQEDSAPPPSIRLRVRTGGSEVEVEAPIRVIREALDLIPELLGKLSSSEGALQQSPTSKLDTFLQVQESKSLKSEVPMMPEVKVEKSDSLTDIITKMFRDTWARQPRRLGEVKEALESLGLIYPRQSVAVSLLRLAKAGRLRRFRGEDGEFVYTSSTALGAEG